MLFAQHQVNDAIDIADAEWTKDVKNVWHGPKEN